MIKKFDLLFTYAKNHWSDKFHIPKNFSAKIFFSRLPSQPTKNYVIHIFADVCSEIFLRRISLPMVLQKEVFNLVKRYKYSSDHVALSYVKLSCSFSQVP